MAIPGLPPAFDAWFARTMEREPARRFNNAAELAEGLTIAAGLSVRRGPLSSQPHGSPLPGPGTPLPSVAQERTPLPAAGLTSAPFVTSASIPKSSKGAVFAVAAAALLGGSLGVVGVVKLLSHPGATTTVTPVVSAPIAASAAVAGIVGGPGPTPTASVTASASAATAASTAPAVAVTALPVPTGHGHGKPVPATKPVTATGPVAAKPPVPKSAPPSSDPGY
jgi:serine/threonine-protein kinase